MRPIIYKHDPEAVLDYSFDWNSWLSAEEKISSYEIEATDPLVVSSTLQTEGFCSAWIAVNPLATVPACGRVTCTITTTYGRTDARSMQLEVQDR